MPIKSLITLAACSLFVLLTACSDDPTNSNEHHSKNTASDQIVKDKPNKFMISAIKKVRMAHETMPLEQAKCVVDDMLADGTIGLGEINQMDISAAGLENNSSGLLQAYKAAISKCK